MEIAEDHSAKFDTKEQSLTLPARIGGWEGMALIDTGSVRTIASPTLIDQIGGILDTNYYEQTAGANGPVYINKRLQASVILNGYLKKNHWIYFVDNSPLLEETPFQAIIGLDILNQLPPMLQDYQRGIIDFAPPNVDALEYFKEKHRQRCAHLAAPLTPPTTVETPSKTTGIDHLESKLESASDEPHSQKILFYDFQRIPGKDTSFTAELYDNGSQLPQ